ncbi:cobaltochelatase CobN subunit [Roseibium hamelinense]|uniref:magnesium chelatase n=1 Tax=Roseibium hamelinense TaxID=150831 RepID=A0A562SXW5_9HYPH|nr:magnesium chelatase subunit H [Roseibium hamelinense]MTI44863.1 magnesium chelatase subunit H [Roseibium hamelinense]TWI85943.1 cobaltochelatase CobN subunit [Roseibium hamelinense]
MPKPISGGNSAAPPAATPVKVVILTLDNHMASAMDRVSAQLKSEMPGLTIKLHALAGWTGEADAAVECREDIETGDVIIANMLFLEDHIRKVLPWLKARRDTCDCMVGCLAATEVVKLTKLGDFAMSEPAGGAIGFLKRLRGKGSGKPGAAGKGQMKMLRQVPKFLKYIPGKAQDVRAYFLVLQYILAGSDENLANLVRYLIGRYASGPRKSLRKQIRAKDPVHYPDIGLYHPRLSQKVTDSLAQFHRDIPVKADAGTVGLLIMRSYVLAENAAHYDGVISELESRGLNVVPAFASGLDARPAIEAFFMKNGRATVDCVISLTGFSLVGGPAYNDSAAADEILRTLDVPYLSAFATEFQTLEQWESGEQGLTPVETTIMMALPEIDGGTNPILFGGRKSGGQRNAGKDMAVHEERVAMLADRAEKLVRLRQTAKADRKIATVLYNFPPNGGATGTAAHLDVFASLFNTLTALKDDGYTVDVPSNVEALRSAVLEGNAAEYGMPAHVAVKIPADDHVRGERWLNDIEAQWGPAPGRVQTDGRNILILGRHFGNVFVGIQPAFGYEGDPMRLLFERGFAPTHAFSAFYTYLKSGFEADAVLHFGTHGALEFMPGKQTGLSQNCWPDRLIGALPNIYLYAANNPSEGTIARRRSAATLVSYLTPPVGHAGLYKGLLDLKSALDRWRSLPPGSEEERSRVSEAIKVQAVQLDLVAEDEDWSSGAAGRIETLIGDVHEFENALIPHGLHVVGQPPADSEREDLLLAVNQTLGEDALTEDVVRALAADTALDVAAGGAPDSAARELSRLNSALQTEHELPALVRALDGRFIPPVNGGDILRSPDIVPTGRNIHGFDPFRLPSAFAIEDGRRQADLLIERHVKDHGIPPRRMAMVLWGTDNLKSEGGPIAQVLALIGAKPRFDSFGRLAGADLMSLEELERPRIDLVITLSGIFRDLLPMQTRMLAEAFFKAASADEPLDMNPIREHALSYSEQHRCSLQEASLRVFSNASGAYGSNVNMLIESGAWAEDDELADTYSKRKSFAYGLDGKPVQREQLLEAVLKDTEMAYQNLDSVELGVTSIDHYFDMLGGISSAIRKAGGKRVAVYVGDQTCGTAKVRSLSEQVALETRTRMLNPKWYEAMLSHGYEGVRQIESHVTNTLGWSATTGQVDPWVYRTLTETFLLDEDMRNRLAELNPKASAKLVNRLIEAGDRNYWTPDEDTWDALRAAGDELEDRVEGIGVEAAA